MGWLILLAPLLAAALVLAGLHRIPRAAQAVSVGACALSFLTALGFVNDWFPAPTPIRWMELPAMGGSHAFQVEIGILIDPLSQLMLLVVTGVGLLIHLFSLGYMAKDPGVGRFFGKLSMFMFSMIGIVVATNLMQMFVFWELVGLSSYLLIGFWFERPSAADAAKKAFLVNRVGDFGFLLGIIFYWTLSGTLMFGAEALSHIAGKEHITLMALLLFCGCMGKSAMLPLHVWLPDAMEGPTPVSALIHAATMVAAGVYMLCRIFPVIALSAFALGVIAWVGAITAVFAALIATQQNDIKRILAYSTLSQLGYMVMAVGCTMPGALFPISSMFHLTTHAFFKAMLFLGAGSVIHSLHHEQNIWQMGGLRKKMPVTFWTFLIGVFALSGVPLFAGFYSKEEILSAAYGADLGIFWIAVLTASLTAFYMTRLLVVAFLGDSRSEHAFHAHESPKVMTVPLIILAVFSVIGGYSWFWISKFLGVHSHHSDGGTVMTCSIVAVVVGMSAGWFFYRGRGQEVICAKPFANKFYIDEIYEGVLIRGQQMVARFCQFLDEWILGFLIVRGSATMTNIGGEILRLFQAGNLQGYVFLFTLGALGLVYWMMKGF